MAAACVACDTDRQPRPDGASWRRMLIHLGAAGWQSIPLQSPRDQASQRLLPDGWDPGLLQLSNPERRRGRPFQAGHIADWETQPDVCGDAFVVAPDGSRASSVWEVV